MHLFAEAAAAFLIRKHITVAPHEEVIETGRRVEERLARLLMRLLPRIAGEQA